MLLKALNSNSLIELKARLALYVRQSPRQSSALLLLLVILVYGSMIPLSSVIDQASSGGLTIDLKIYDAMPGVKEFEHLDEVDLDKNLQPIPGFVSIDQAHREGNYHTGAWIYLLDATGRKILLLRRGPELVTCPNAWGLIGEHTKYDETPLETVQRGLVEEIWGGSNASYTDVQYIRNLTADPVFFIKDYGDRKDRQFTYLYEVRLKQEAQNVVLYLDHEVADHQWIDAAEYKQWLERDASLGHKDFCHSTVTRLALYSLQRLGAVEGLELQ